MKIENGSTRLKLDRIYHQAAHAALEDGVNLENGDDELISWIQTNCNYDPENLFFLVLGIGAEMADIEATGKGYKSQVDEIWQTKIAPNWKCDKFGKWHRIKN